jgi:hypothetical protein
MPPPEALHGSPSDHHRIILGGQLVAITALVALRPILMRWVASRHAAEPAL